MGGLARCAFALALVGGCATETESEMPTVLVEGQTFTMASAIAIDDVSAAVLNVGDDPCGVYFDGAGADRVDGEAPMLLGAFALGPSGVLAIDGDDPRTYVTVGAPGDTVILADGVVDVRLTFSRVLRQVRVGVDWYLEVEVLDEPIVVEQQLAALECEQ